MGVFSALTGALTALLAWGAISLLAQYGPDMPREACAQENGVCSFSGARFVLFGVAGTFAAKALLKRHACNTATFGDPVPNVGKACYLLPTTLRSTLCSKDGESCHFEGTRLVIYGTSAFATHTIVRRLP